MGLKRIKSCNLGFNLISSGKKVRLSQPEFCKLRMGHNVLLLFFLNLINLEFNRMNHQLVAGMNVFFIFQPIPND